MRMLLFDFFFLGLVCLTIQTSTQKHFAISPVGTSDTPTDCEFSSSSSIPATTCRNIQPILEQFINASSEVDVTIRVASGKYDAPLSLQGLHLPRVSLFLVPADSIAQIECPDNYDSFLSNIAVIFNLTVLSKITISDIKFTRCGPLSPVIFVNSVNIPIYFQSLHFTNNSQSAFLIQNSYKISVYNCSFIDNDMMYNSTFIKTFDNHDLDSSFSPELHTQSGGAIIVIVDIKTTLPYGLESIITISQSTFIRNKCIQVGNDLVPYFYGGGIAIFFYEETYQILIFDNYFEDNCACRGGGAIGVFAAAGSSSSHYVYIHNNVFFKNKANFVGGAVVIRENYVLARNVYEFYRNNFTSNIALIGGGGLSCYFPDSSNLNYDEDFHYKTKDDIEKRRMSYSRINLIENIWFDNIAFSGYSGHSLRYVSLRKYSNYPPILFMRDMVFERSIKGCEECPLPQNMCFSNRIQFLPTTTNYEILLSGALVVTHNNITLKGAGNTTNCGGIFMLNSYLFIAGNMLIQDYQTTSGSGIYTRKYSRILFKRGANLTFARNHATLFGGAMVNKFATDAGYSRFDFYNPYCALGLMSDPKASLYNWNVIVKFVNNSAKIAGGALYTNNLELCTWITNDVEPIFSTELALNVPNVFIYENNGIYLGSGREFESYFVKSDISSSPVSFSVYPTDNGITREPQPDGSTHLYIPSRPGEVFHLPFLAFDINNNPTIGLVVVTYTCTDDVTIYKRTYAIGLKLYYCLKSLPSEQCKDIMNFFQYFLEKKPTKKCNFKFVLVDDILETKDVGIINQISFTPEYECNAGYKLEVGVCKCDSTSYAVDKCNDQGAYFFNGYWIGDINNHTTTKSSIYSCPTGYCLCDKNNQQLSCLPKLNSNDYCYRNTKGVMCGDCDEHHTHMTPFGCVPHPSSNFIWVLVFYMIITTAVCVFVFLLNIRTWNGIRSSVLALLLFPFIFDLNFILGSGSEIPIILSQLISLNFIVIPHAPPIKDMSYLQSLSLNCYSIFIVLIVGVIAAGLAILLKRFQFSILQSKRLIDSFLFLWFLVYGKLVVIIVKVIACAPNIDGTNYRLFYSGNVKCYEGEHIPHYIINILVLFFLVIPTPFIIGGITNRYFLRRYLKLAILVSTFKESSKMFWIWEFIRLSLLLLASLYDEYLKVKFNLLIVVVFVLTVHQLTLPYREKFANVVESVIWLILALLVILANYTSLFFIVIQGILFFLLMSVILFSFVLFVIQVTVVVLYRYHRVQAWFDRKKQKVSEMNLYYRVLFWIINIICGDLEAEINVRHEISGDISTIRNSYFITRKRSSYLPHNDNSDVPHKDLSSSMISARRDTLLKKSSLFS